MVPGILAAAPVPTATVIGYALCRDPTEMARHADIHGLCFDFSFCPCQCNPAAREMMDTFGAEVDFVLASSQFLYEAACLNAAMQRIRSMCSITSLFWFNSTSSVPLMPKVFRADEHRSGWSSPTTVTSISTVTRNIEDITLVSGREQLSGRWHLPDPSKYISMRHPVPGTPWIDLISVYHGMTVLHTDMLLE